MKDSLREVLADSHVAAVAIAVLLFWSMDSIFRALWPFISDVGEFVITALAILDVPYVSFPSLSTMALISSGWFLYVAFVGWGGAWVLSRWVYKSWPIRFLMTVRGTKTGNINAEV